MTAGTTNVLGRTLMMQGPSALARKIAAEPAILKDRTALRDLGETVDYYITALRKEGADEQDIGYLLRLAEMIKIHGASADVSGDPVVPLAAFLERLPQAEAARARMQRLSLWAEPETVTAALTDTLRRRDGGWTERLGGLTPERLSKIVSETSYDIHGRRAALLLLVEGFVELRFENERTGLKDLVENPKYDDFFDATAIRLMWDAMRELPKPDTHAFDLLGEPSVAARTTAETLRTWLKILYGRDPSSDRFTDEMRRELAK